MNLLLMLEGGKDNTGVQEPGRIRPITMTLMSLAATAIDQVPTLWFFWSVGLVHTAVT